MYITKEQAINAMKTDPHQFERISILADRCNVKLKGAENMTFFAAITTADGKALLDELLATLAANKCSCIIYNKRDGWRGEMVAGDIPQKIGIRGAAKVLPVKKEEIFAAAAPVQERTEDGEDRHQQDHAIAGARFHRAFHRSARRSGLPAIRSSTGYCRPPW